MRNNFTMLYGAPMDMDDVFNEPPSVESDKIIALKARISALEIENAKKDDHIKELRELLEFKREAIERLKAEIEELKRKQHATLVIVDEQQAEIARLRELRTVEEGWTCTCGQWNSENTENCVNCNREFWQGAITPREKGENYEK
jgi:uncharacterized coiled-coil protein SlyX